MNNTPNQTPNALCLFIGGPADQRTIAIPANQWRVAMRGDVFYRAELLAGEKTQIRVFIVDGMSIDEALDRLIRRYARNTIPPTSPGLR